MAFQTVTANKGIGGTVICLAQEDRSKNPVVKRLVIINSDTLEVQEIIQGENAKAEMNAAMQKLEFERQAANDSGSLAAMLKNAIEPVAPAPVVEEPGPAVLIIDEPTAEAEPTE